MRRNEYLADNEVVAERPSPSKHDDAPLVQAALAAGAPTPVQRAAMLDLQRAAGNSSAAALLEEDDAAAGVRETVASGGHALDDDTRTLMEGRMGADFSDVRVHSDTGAQRSAQRMNAHAYTVGSDIVFGEGQYQPGTDSGRKTLAHELTHVVQQRSGPVSGTAIGGGVQVSDPSDAFEQAAERNATEVMSAAPAAGTAVQREAEDEEELQMLPAQREESAEAEEEEVLAEE